MAETKKFVDLSGLDYFWGKVEPIITDGDAAAKTYAENKATEALNTAKTYVDGKVDGKFDTVGSAAQALADAKTYFNTENAKDATRMLAIEGDVAALEATVGDATSGLVKDVKSIQDELNSLSGGAGSIATQIDNAIAALDLPNTYEAKGEAAKAETAAKAYADGLAVNYDAAGAADTALASAKSYADGLATNYDAAGAAATALTDAKSYADGLNTTMDGRVDKLEAINHEAIAAQAAADAVAAVVANAPEDFNTLKEVADYIAADKTKASEIETAISNLRQEDSKIREDFADADAQVLADAKEDATTKANAAQAAAIEAAATDATSKADAAQSAAIEAAKADAESKYQVKGDYEAAGTAAGLNTAMDARVKVLEGINHEAYKAADTALETALKAYADQAEADAVAAIVAVSNSDIDALFTKQA